MHNCVKVGGIGNNAKLGSLGFAPFTISIEIVLLIDKETMPAMLAWLIPTAFVSLIKGEFGLITGILLFI